VCDHANMYADVLHIQMGIKWCNCFFRFIKSNITRL